MKKSVYVLAILAAAISTSAVAKDLKQDKKATAPTVKATVMNDAEMDKVTAGGPGASDFGLGVACGASGSSPPCGLTPGLGTGTAASTGHFPF